MRSVAIRTDRGDKVAFADVLERGDSPAVYRDRAVSIFGSDAELWFRCGLDDLREGHPHRVRDSWRNCLRHAQLAEERQAFLGEMLRLGSGKIPAEVWAREILPPDTGLLVDAALRLYPGADGKARRRPFLDQVAALFERRPGERTAKAYHLRGVLEEAQGEADAALRSWKAALERDPDQADWRVEYARLLSRSGHPDQAFDEVGEALARSPGHAGARQLRNELLGLPAGTR